jgi:phage protein U
MYGQLGDIIFDKLYGLDSFNLKAAQVISEHARIDGKPRLENSGSKADEVSISFMLSSYFANPEQQIDKIKGYKDTAEVLTFINGAGIVFGDYVIKEYDYTIDTLTPGGQIINATVNITLIENYYSDRKKSEETNAAKDGFATPGTISKVAPIQWSGESSLVVQDAQKINTNATTVTDNLSKAQKLSDQANVWMDKSSKKLDETRNSINSMQNKLTNSVTLGSSATNLLAQIPALLSSLNALQTPLNLHDLQTATGLNSLFQAQTAITNTLMAPIAGMVATKG